MFLDQSRDIDLGRVKILKSGEVRPSLRDEFPTLGDDCCSVGSDTYYLGLCDVPELASRILEALRDAAWSADIESKFKSEGGFEESLLRSHRDGLAQPRAILDLLRQPPRTAGSTPAWIYLLPFSEGWPKDDVGTAWLPLRPWDGLLFPGGPLGVLRTARPAGEDDVVGMVGHFASLPVDLWDPIAAEQIDPGTRAGIPSRFAVQISYTRFDDVQGQVTAQVLSPVPRTRVIPASSA